MRLLLSALVVLCITFSAIAQDHGLARTKLAEAKKAYEIKDYQAALLSLDEAENALGSVNQEMLYLRVVAQNKIVEKEPLKDFASLMQLKDNSKVYLTTYKDQPADQQRYQEVYQIWDKFGKAYPADKEAYDAAVIRNTIQKQQVDKARETRKEIRERAMRHEEQRKIRKEEYQKIRKDRTFGYVAIRAGLATPLSSEAKSMITVEEFENSGGFSLPFQRGKFGLKSGYSIGISGITPLDFINRDIQEGSLHPTFGFGLSLDFNQTWMRYNWEALDQPENDSYILVRDAEYKSFGITSFGVGPAVCFRPSPKPMYFDLFLRPDLNLIWGGRYYVNTNMPGSGTKYEITSERLERKIKLGSTLGLNFRYKWVLLGAEVRSGLQDKAEFQESYVIKGSTSTSYLNKKTKFSTAGLTLNYAALRFGVAF